MTIGGCSARSWLHVEPIRKSVCHRRKIPMISLAELQRRIDAGDLSAEAALAQSQEAIAAQEEIIGAFVCRSEKSRAQAAGPLRGIAVGIKDIIDTADLPTEMGAAIY